MTTAYAIGDIHGHSDQLAARHALIAADMQVHGPAPVIHIGDLVDRGPDSPGVIDFLLEGIARGEDWSVLTGNHDRLFALFMEGPDLHDPRLRPDLSWLHPRIGGVATLTAYGVKKAADRPVGRVWEDARVNVPEAHLAFLRGLPTMRRIGDLAFVHAGVRPGVDLAAQVEDDLVWIREPFLSDLSDHGALIVHGHTAIDAATDYGNRVNLDSGAAYGGPLSAVAFEGRVPFLLTANGRVPLPRG